MPIAPGTILEGGSLVRKAETSWDYLVADDDGMVRETKRFVVGNQIASGRLCDIYECSHHLSGTDGEEAIVRKPMVIQDKLLETGRPFYIIASGAGAGLQDLIWKTPGISKVLLGAEFPYNEKMIDRCLGFCPREGNAPASYCSAEVAVDLATTAFYRALEGAPEAPVVGVGLTASVASTRAHRGDHRVFAATVSDEGCILRSLILEKGVGEEQRARDGKICDLIGLSALIEATLGEPSTVLVNVASPYAQSLLTVPAQDLLEARFFSHPYFTSDEKRLSVIPPGPMIYPGTFSPLTYGHQGVSMEAQKAYLRRDPANPIPDVVLSITANPPHKDPATVQELLRRAHTLRGYHRVFVKDEPFYIHKARKRPHSTFILGADALLNMLDPKWGVSYEQLLQELHHLGAMFYVAERLVDNHWVGLQDIGIPSQYEGMFYPIQGRWLISSTQVRNELKHC